MPTKTYYSVAGEIIAEETGGVRTDYITDALGSIVGTVDSSQAVVNTYRFKPYGALLAKTGTGPDPRFLWTGNTGSRTTNLNRAEQYNRARHLGVKEGTWTSVDPLWPDEMAYGYVKGNPSTKIDPFGDYCKDSGTVPARVKCFTHPIFYGKAGCDESTGKMWMKMCDTTSCACGCIFQHEDVHIKDIGTCCSRIKKCEQWCKANPRKCPSGICSNKYGKWVAAIRPWTECRAYKVQLSCAKKVYDREGCLTTRSVCCEITEEYIDSAKDGMSVNCSAPKFVNCPFESNGKLIP